MSQSIQDSQKDKGIESPWIPITITSASGTVEGTFAYLQADTDCEYSATSSYGTDGDLPNQFRSEGSLKAGLYTSVTVTSGTVTAYYQKRRSNV